MKTNVILSEETEKTLKKLAWLDRTATREKGKRIDFVCSIARSFYDHADDETFLQITGIKK